MRYGPIPVSLLVAATLAGGCGGTANRVPDVEGHRLDAAQEKLDDAGLGYEVTGGGALGAVARSNWTVCEQRPAPGKRAKSVELRVGRSCPSAEGAGTVPYVVGLSLDEAKRKLERRDLDYEVVDQGLGDVLVDSSWTVCDQYSAERSSSVQLYVEHVCDYDEDDDDDDF
jgi:hypothetical protein